MVMGIGMEMEMEMVMAMVMVMVMATVMAIAMGMGDGGGDGLPRVEKTSVPCVEWFCFSHHREDHKSSHRSNQDGDGFSRLHIRR